MILKMTKNKKGFTLVELLVVIAIIAILSTIAFVSVRGIRLRAFDTQIKGELSQIRISADSHYFDELGGDGSYDNYLTNTEWTNLRTRIPRCSIASLSPPFPSPPLGTGSYQIILQGSPTPGPSQRFIAWAPLCSNTARAQCVDSLGNSLEIRLNPLATINTNGFIRGVNSAGPNRVFNCVCHTGATPLPIECN